MTADSRPFLDKAESRILSYLRDRRDANLYDTIVAIVQSQSGSIYEGIPFETSQPLFNFCAERHALNNMLHSEPGCNQFDCLLVAGPVPDATDGVITPCGACRHALYNLAPDATIYCSNFVREDEGWNMFPSIERYTSADLHPHHQSLPTWD